MNIYDLNETHYLYHDIVEVINKIEKLYKVDFKFGKTNYYPKTIVDKKHAWTSEMCNEAFNKLVPSVKSLHKDMYAILEVFYKSKIGQFDKLLLEKKYPGLREFRLLNNKFKHYNDKEAEITLTELVMITPNGHLIDVYCNFKEKTGLKIFRFCDFIDLFLKIIEDEKIISINWE